MNGLVRNTRERLIERSRPFLEPGEDVAHVVRALEGPSRWIAMALAFVVAYGLLLATGGFAPLGLVGFGLVYTRLYARRLILATDRRLAILAGGRFRFTPKKLLDTLPVDTRIGPLTGLFLNTSLNGRRLFIVPRSIRAVAAADADILDAEMSDPGITDPSITDPSITDADD